jgi:hypothetical protein
MRNAITAYLRVMYACFFLREIERSICRAASWLGTLAVLWG